MYKYEDYKDKLLSIEGTEMFFNVKKRIDNFLSLSGAFKIENVITKMSGDSWLIMACVDRLVEIAYLKELTDKNVMGQNRVFVKN